MSWEIVLFNTKQIIHSIDEIDESQFELTDFCDVLESCFVNITEEDNHIEIKGADFTIDYFKDDEMVSNKMLSLYGENALFELIPISKKNNWQIFDTSLGEMIDLDNPANNGYDNFQSYLKQILK